MKEYKITYKEDREGAYPEYYYTTTEEKRVEYVNALSSVGCVLIRIESREVTEWEEV